MELSEFCHSDWILVTRCPQGGIDLALVRMNSMRAVYEQPAAQPLTIPTCRIVETPSDCGTNKQTIIIIITTTITTIIIIIIITLPLPLQYCYY